MEQGLGPPPPLTAGQPARSASSGVDGKLTQTDGRRRLRASRPDSIILREADISALASQYLADAGFLTSSFTTEMHHGRVMVQWRGPVGMLLQGPPLEWIAPVLPSRFRGSPVWVTLAGGVQLQPAPAPGRPRYAEVSLESVRLGRLPVPGWLLTLMAGPRGASLLRWPVPGTVERLELGEGRLTIRTR